MIHYRSQQNIIYIKKIKKLINFRFQKQKDQILLKTDEKSVNFRIQTEN